jgi:hypothetical protein
VNSELRFQNALGNNLPVKHTGCRCDKYLVLPEEDLAGAAVFAKTVMFVVMFRWFLAQHRFWLAGFAYVATAGSTNALVRSFHLRLAGRAIIVVGMRNIEVYRCCQERHHPSHKSQNQQ